MSTAEYKYTQKQFALILRWLIKYTLKENEGLGA